MSMLWNTWKERELKFIKEVRTQEELKTLSMEVQLLIQRNEVLESEIKYKTIQNELWKHRCKLRSLEKSIRNKQSSDLSPINSDEGLSHLQLENVSEDDEPYIPEHLNTGNMFAFHNLINAISPNFKQINSMRHQTTSTQNDIESSSKQLVLDEQSLEKNSKQIERKLIQEFESNKENLDFMKLNKLKKISV